MSTLWLSDEELIDATHQPPADEASEREKFERWAQANTPLKFGRDLASYFSGTTQFAWMAWIERAAATPLPTHPQQEKP